MRISRVCVEVHLIKFGSTMLIVLLPKVSIDVGVVDTKGLEETRCSGVELDYVLKKLHASSNKCI